MSLTTAFNGWKRNIDGVATDLSAVGGGQQRFQLGNATLSNVGADTVALLHGLGTSGSPVATTSGSVNFMGYWMTTSAQSGDVRGMYLRLFFTGAGGTGEAARIFASVTNVAASTVRGAHISLEFAASGTVTGLGVALECTLHLNSGGTAGGTLAPLKVAINSDNAASDPAGSTLSFIQVVNQGLALDDVDDDAFLFDFSGFTAGANKMWSDTTSGVGDEFLRVKTPNGTRYLILSDTISLT
jgi:hypothetical protein